MHDGLLPATTVSDKGIHRAQTDIVHNKTHARRAWCLLSPLVKMRLLGLAAAASWRRHRPRHVCSGAASPVLGPITTSSATTPSALCSSYTQLFCTCDLSLHTLHCPVACLQEPQQPARREVSRVARQSGLRTSLRRRYRARRTTAARPLTCRSHTASPSSYASPPLYSSRGQA